MPGRVRIKYCGGCNPRYDRKVLAARLLADFPDLDMPETDEGGGPYDFVAVLCGCPAACAEQERRVAEAMALVHCEVTGAPPKLVHVIIHVALSSQGNRMNN